MLVEGLERPPHRTLFPPGKEPCVHSMKRAESRKILGQWAWRVWWGWERFQSLQKRQDGHRGRCPALWMGTLLGAWVSQHRAEAGSGEGVAQHSIATVPEPSAASGGGGQTLSLDSPLGRLCNIGQGGVTTCPKTDLTSVVGELAPHLAPHPSLFWRWTQPLPHPLLTPRASCPLSAPPLISQSISLCFKAGVRIPFLAVS